MPLSFDLKSLVNTEILKLISGLDEFKGRWSATTLLAPDRLEALRHVATIESVGSSTRIEGVKLTNAEIEALLKGVKTFSFKSRDEQEVAGYAELIETIFSSWQEIPFTENHIKQLHGVLLKHSPKDERHRGEYKKFPNNVEAFDADGKSVGIIFETTKPFGTPKEMKELVEWTSHELKKNELHSLLVISTFVVYFLKIHPFQDGNGRLSRALTALLLLKSGYSYVPYSSLERVIEENKDSYYLNLRRAQGTLDTGAKKLIDWILFFLQCMQKQKTVLEKKLQDEKLLERLPELSMQIIEIIKARGSASIADVALLTKSNRNTIKVHLAKLVAQNYLAKKGIGKATRYQIFNR